MALRWGLSVNLVLPGWTGNSRESTSLWPLPTLGLQACGYAWLLCGCWDLNGGHQAYAGRALTHWPIPPSPAFCFGDRVSHETGWSISLKDLPVCVFPEWGWPASTTLLGLFFPYLFFLWALGDQTQALKRARQALYLLRHLPSLLLKNFKNKKFYSYWSTLTFSGFVSNFPLLGP